MKNHSIYEFTNVAIMYRTMSGREFFVKPDNFNKISSFSQRLHAALLVLSGKACANKWYTTSFLNKNKKY
ncbi:MAG: hypothetical protein WC438_05480 [Candidatus Pacearchaeota archaeon]